jgi:hypothetical protein
LCAARNQSLKRLRRVHREVQREIDNRSPDGASGPLGLLLAEEEARLVRQAVLALAPLHREVLILVEYEGMALSEVAEVGESLAIEYPPALEVHDDELLMLELMANPTTGEKLSAM